MRKLKFLVLGGILFIFPAACVLAVWLAEITLHPPRKMSGRTAQTRAGVIARKHGAKLKLVQITAEDQVVLKAWFFDTLPDQRSVILIHGQGDDRSGMLKYANLFLNQRYSVLVPDMRAHGLSGGAFATYGLKEKYDIRQWVSWLDDQTHPDEIFALGESMGAAIILQALEVEERLRGVIAESSFCNFTEIAKDRIGGYTVAGRLLARIGLIQPLLDLTYGYSWHRYGVDFTSVSPESAVATTHTPVLLIHGLQDKSIKPYHSERIFKRRSHSDQIWIWRVPETKHSGAIGKKPDEFERRVLDFCRSNLRKPPTLAGRTSP